MRYIVLNEDKYHQIYRKQDVCDKRFLWPLTLNIWWREYEISWEFSSNNAEVSNVFSGLVSADFTIVNTQT